MKKNVIILIGVFVAALAVTFGLNEGLKSAGRTSIPNALADVIITRTCPDCKGSGKIYIRKKCYSCPNGYEEVPKTCPTCNGTGKIKERKSR